MDLSYLYQLYLDSGCRVSSDSRAIEGGEIFFALKGENFDGNTFALKALEQGASYAVIDDRGIFEALIESFQDQSPSVSPEISSGVLLEKSPEYASESPKLSSECSSNSGQAASKSLINRLILVDDAFATLQQLAIYHRNSIPNLKVLGITGTNGKTTTKNLIEAVLSTSYRTIATKGNLNNDIGVPLTLLSLRPDTQIAIIEMGANHPDDIAKLVRVCQPDYGIITNVGKAHLQGFASLEGVKAAKGELYKWLATRKRSYIFINEDDPVLKEMAASIPCHFYGYGLKYQGAKVLPTQTNLRLQLEDSVIETQLVGAYNSANILAALAIGEYFGVRRELAIKAIEDYTPRDKRSQIILSGSNTIILDAYNANPSSMAVAIENLKSMSAEHKLALLGDMRELGEDSLVEHIAVLNRLKDTGIDALLVGKEFASAVSCQGGDYACFPSSEALAEYLLTHKPDNTLILIKASRGIALEKVLESL